MKTNTRISALSRQNLRQATKEVKGQIEKMAGGFVVRLKLGDKVSYVSSPHGPQVYPSAEKARRAVAGINPSLAKRLQYWEREVSEGR